MSQFSSKVGKNFWYTHILSSWLNLCLPSVRESYFSKGSPLGTLHLNNQSPKTGPQQEKAVFFPVSASEGLAVSGAGGDNPLDRVCLGKGQPAAAWFWAVGPVNPHILEVNIQKMPEVRVQTDSLRLSLYQD